MIVLVAACSGPAPQSGGRGQCGRRRETLVAPVETPDSSADAAPAMQQPLLCRGGR
ncbi:MAG: hypothetical protein R2851_09265 [Caldilineaceae bacterium]